MTLSVLPHWDVKRPRMGLWGRCFGHHTVAMTGYFPVIWDKQETLWQAGWALARW